MSEARRAQASEVRSEPKASEVHELVATFSALDRRAFLRLAGLAAGAGLLGSGCDRVPAELLPPSSAELRFLTPRTWAVFTAAAARIAGPAAGDRIRTRRLEPGARAEAFLASAPTLAAPLRQALLVLEFGIPPVLAKLRPFTALEPDGQDAILDELMRSRFETKRLLFGGVRSLALLACYADPASRDWMDYPPERPRPGADISAAHGEPGA